MTGCSFCGFVNGPDSASCVNCGSPLEVKRLAVAEPSPDLYGHNEHPRTPRVATGRYRAPRRPYRTFKFIFLAVIIGVLFLPQAEPFTTPLKEQLGLFWEDLNTPYYSYPATLDVTLQRTFIISNDQDHPASYNLVLNRPDATSPYLFGEPTYQRVNYVESTVPYHAFPAPDFMHWNGTLESHSSVEIVVTYSLQVEAIGQDLTPAKVGQVQDIPQAYRDLYLGPEWKIDPDNAQVQELARQAMSGAEGNVLLILRNIFDFIGNNITYSLGTYPKTCDETLARAKGDCDDMGILFASIARAAGIPAWLELGLLSDSHLTDWTPHAWVDAVIPLSAPGPDEASHIIGRIDLANRFFLWMPPFRISEGVSNGTADQMLNYYYSFYSPNGAKESRSITTLTSASTGNLKRELD